MVSRPVVYPPRNRAGLAPLMLRERFKILHARTGVEENDSLVTAHLAALDEHLERRDARAALGRREDALGRGREADAGDERLVGDGDGGAAARAHRAQDQEIADGAGNAQPRRDGARVWKLCGRLGSSFERRTDWRAAGW